MTVNELKSLLARFHIKPDKRLGQNFLLSEGVLDKIVAAAALTKQDRVLEIGPGLGILTKRLAQEAGEVMAIEKDRKLARALNKIFKNYKNIKIIQGDALFFNPTVYGLQSTNYKLVANIPYYLTGQILQKFLSPTSLPTSLHRLERGAPSPGDGEGLRERSWPRPSLMVLLLQKEVAERITAKPGQMSILAVSVQFYADPEIVAVVPKENFYPPPEVDSAIVKITPLSSPLAKGGKRGVGLQVNEKKFFQLVKIGFQSKRKQLHNNLRALPLTLPSPARGEGGRRPGEGRDYKQLLQDLGLNPLARAQDLSLPDWGKLYERLFEPASPLPLHRLERD